VFVGVVLSRSGAPKPTIRCRGEHKRDRRRTDESCLAFPKTVIVDLEYIRRVLPKEIGDNMIFTFSFSLMVSFAVETEVSFQGFQGHIRIETLDVTMLLLILYCSIGS
jgi:hypothetical protein